MRARLANFAAKWVADVAGSTFMTCVSNFPEA
jgi:hypothetical protein